MENIKIRKITILILVVIIILWGASFLIHLTKYKSSTLGQLGDSFGVVNSLFSGLAFGGLIITILLQREELRDQKNILMDQKKELQLTREIFETQTDLSRIESLESSFWKIVDRINVHDNEGMYYTKFYREIKQELTYYNSLDELEAGPKVENLNSIVAKYLEPSHQRKLFKSKLIDKSNINSIVILFEMYDDIVSKRKEYYLSILKNAMGYMAFDSLIMLYFLDKDRVEHNLYHDSFYKFFNNKDVGSLELPNTTAI